MHSFLPLVMVQAASTAVDIVTRGMPERKQRLLHLPFHLFTHTILNMSVVVYSVPVHVFPGMHALVRRNHVWHGVARENHARTHSRETERHTECGCNFYDHASCHAMQPPMLSTTRLCLWLCVSLKTLKERRHNCTFKHGSNNSPPCSTLDCLLRFPLRLTHRVS